MVLRSCSARATETPGLSRPIALRKCMPRLVVEEFAGPLSTASVVQIPFSGAVMGKRKLGGMTPTMLNSSPLR